MTSVNTMRKLIASTCTYCSQAKGKRACPALGALICPRCCGEHRLVRIECPTDCKYLTTNESYQRERSAQAFVMERAKALQAYKDSKAVMAVVGLEMTVYKHLTKHPQTREWEIIAGMEEIRKRLSPLAFPDSERSTHGESLWTDFEPFLKEIDRSEAADIIGAYISFAKSFSGDELGSRQFQRGLLGFLQQYQSDILEKMPQQENQSRIITA